MHTKSWDSVPAGVARANNVYALTVLSATSDLPCLTFFSTGDNPVKTAAGADVKLPVLIELAFPGLAYTV